MNQKLVGRTFVVGDGEYRVVDVRQLSGELMVYAEELDQTLDQDKVVSQERKPRRAAFHYGDIASYIDNNTA